MIDVTPPIELVWLVFPTLDLSTALAACWFEDECSLLWFEKFLGNDWNEFDFSLGFFELSFRFKLEKLLFSMLNCSCLSALPGPPVPGCLLTKNKKIKILWKFVKFYFIFKFLHKLDCFVVGDANFSWLSLWFFIIFLATSSESLKKFIAKNLNFLIKN